MFQRHLKSQLEATISSKRALCVMHPFLLARQKSEQILLAMVAKPMQPFLSSLQLYYRPQPVYLLPLLKMGLQFQMVFLTFGDVNFHSMVVQCPSIIDYLQDVSTEVKIQCLTILLNLVLYI